MGHYVDIDKLVAELEAGWLPTEHDGKFVFDYESADDLMVTAAKTIVDIMSELNDVRDIVYAFVDTLNAMHEQVVDAFQNPLDMYNKYTPKHV